MTTCTNTSSTPKWPSKKRGGFIGQVSYWLTAMLLLPFVMIVQEHMTSLSSTNYCISHYFGKQVAMSPQHWKDKFNRQASLELETNRIKTRKLILDNKVALYTMV